MNSLPLISIVIATYNEQKNIFKFLTSLTMQNYPRDRLEIIIVDGGSTDGTIEIAKKFKVKIIINKNKFAEPGNRYAIQKAKGELILVLSVDNYFPVNDSISKLQFVFKQGDIDIAIPKQDSDNNDSFITKYINTFSDPFTHFVYGYASNSRTFDLVYNKKQNNENYDVYDFHTSKLRPIIALAQGIMIRKELVIKDSSIDDIILLHNLIRRDVNIAYIYTVRLIHHTVSDLPHFYKKQCWRVNNALQKRNFGINSRSTTLTGFQRLKIILYPLYSLSIIFPVIYSIYHLIKDKNALWIYHPFLSFVSGLAIVNTSIKYYSKIDKAIKLK